MQAEVLRPSRREDLPALVELWQLAFGDTQEYIRGFFDLVDDPERVLVLEQGGRVQAMACWLVTPLVRPDGREERAAYLYAVATRPERRGEGCGVRLLDYARRRLGELGFVWLTTVPARPELHGFFARGGFVEGLSLARATLIPDGGEEARVEQVGPEEYGRLRRAALAGRARVEYEPMALAYQQHACALSGGGLYRVDEGCACVERSWDGRVVVKELLAEAGGEQRAVNALARLHPAPDYEVRTPWPGPGERVDFAMVLPLCPQGAWPGPDTYLGLAFD